MISFQADMPSKSISVIRADFTRHVKVIYSKQLTMTNPVVQFQDVSQVVQSGASTTPDWMLVPNYQAHKSIWL